jgi:hypothetical protein
MDRIIELLTASTRSEDVDKATKSLDELSRTTPSYSILLLKIMTNPECTNTIAQLAAITFKN